MAVEPDAGVFIAWKVFQRRVEILAPRLSLTIRYFHYDWEERSKPHKAASYAVKSVATLRWLLRRRPALVFIQLPPTPALYCVALYAWLTGARYVSDCHTSMLYGHWSYWPLAARLLKAGVVVAHNEHSARRAERTLGLAPLVLSTGIAQVSSPPARPGPRLAGLSLAAGKYVILPWNIASDEPLAAAVEAARLLPEVRFVLTWYAQRLPNDLRARLPANFSLTGFLPQDEFNQLYGAAGVALVLTNREDTQLSGMQEALAFEIPAVVSDLKTTRHLYGAAPVYVRNDPEAIAQGIRRAFENRPALQASMRSLKIQLSAEFAEQLAQMARGLAVPVRDVSFGDAVGRTG